MTLYGFVRPRAAVDDTGGQRVWLADVGVGEGNIHAAWSALDDVAADGDTVLVTSLYRLGATMTECLDRVVGLNERGVTVTALDRAGVDMGEASRVLIELRRVYAAERSSRARARRGAVSGRTGRPVKLTPGQVAAAAERVDGGASVPSVAAELGVSRRTLERRLAERRGGS